MSIDPPIRWFNWVVWATGGREGPLGNFYVPTLEEEADTRFYALERRRTELEMAREDAEKSLERLETTVKRLWEKDKRAQARLKAGELHAQTLEVRRLDVERRLVANELAAVGQVRAGNVVQESMMFRARAARERFETAPPRFMQYVMCEIARLDAAEQVTQESIEEMYREADTQLAERTASSDERDADAAEAVLESLGLVARLEAAPPAPVALPGELGSSERP